jgi:hypothetical protein
VERLDPDRLPPLAALVDALVDAADTAQPLFTGPPPNQVAAQAIAAERGLFSSSVRRWIAHGDIEVEPLAYRRVVEADESTQRQTRLRQRWGLTGRSWYPLLADPTPPEVLVLAETSMWDGRAIAHVRGLLHEMGNHRITELREYGPEYVVDVALFAPRYTGAEGVWSDETLDWIAFVSHEGTVAFGGVLAEALRTTSPDINKWRLPPG